VEGAALMSSYEPLFQSEWSGIGVWLGGSVSEPPYAAEIHDRWLPDAQPCYVLTAEGWAVDQEVTELLLRSLTARGA
jgi:hypothetical protein